LAGASSIDLGGNSGWAFVTCGTQAIISATSLNKIEIFPNPASESIHILVPDGKKYHFKLIDNFGRIVSEGSEPGSVFYILCKSLFKGIYYLQLTTDDGQSTITKKVVID
jgi:hypothetical protein